MTDTGAPATSTPPIAVTAPETYRYELRMGYHTAVVEKDPKVVDRWNLVVIANLAGQSIAIEAIYYDDPQVALANANNLLLAATDVESQIRLKWYMAYRPAIGRQSAPTAKGPGWVPDGDGVGADAPPPPPPVEPTPESAPEPTPDTPAP